MIDTKKINEIKWDLLRLKDLIKKNAKFIFFGLYRIPMNKVDTILCSIYAKFSDILNGVDVVKNKNLYSITAFDTFVRYLNQHADTNRNFATISLMKVNKLIDVTIEHIGSDIRYLLNGK